MSHKALRLLIRDVAKSLADNIKFGYGRGSDFNVIRDKTYPYIWMDPLQVATTFSNNDVQNYQKTWSVTMAFYKMDTEGSTEEQYQLILDEMDELVDRFLNKLNRFSETQEAEGDLITDEIVITSVAQMPFIKLMADILTGYALTFTIQVPDKFDYCSLYDN